jgi:biopolymer transport protein ExbB
MNHEKRPRLLKPFELVTLMCVCLHIATPTQAQTPSAEHLQKQLAQLDVQYEEELEQLETARESHRNGANNLKLQRKELATELFQLEIDTLNEKERHDSLAKDWEAKNARNASLRTLTSESLQHFKKVLELLSIYLAEIPAARDARKTVGKALSELQHQPAEFSDVQLSNLLETIDHLHEQATSISAEETSLYTANGALETVDLLTVGHVAFAYRTREDNRIGIALNSPADATGFRWSEQLNNKQKATLAATLEKVESGETGLYHPCMDISQSITADQIGAASPLIAYLTSGGMVMIPLLFVALIAIGLILERFIFLRRLNDSSTTIKRILDHAQSGRISDALSCSESSSGIASNTLAACLGQSNSGQSAMEDAVQAQLLYDAPRLQKNLGGIVALGAVAPLLGLLGTVTGIIHTFDAIKVQTSPQPGMLAGGISEALITTATGLVIAIPVLLFHRLLSARAERQLSRAEQHAASLLMMLNHRDRSEASAQS